MSDPLLDKIKRIKNASKTIERQTRKSNSESVSYQAHAKLSFFMVYFLQVMAGWLWVHQKITKPIFIWCIWKPGKFLWLRYRQLWDFVVNKEDEFGTRRFVWWRAGAMVFGTSFSTWFLTIPLLVCFWDASWYVATAKHEVLYLTFSQEVDPENNIHSVRGCEKLGLTQGCSDEDTVYFRVKPTLFNHIWSFVHKGIPFYPDYIAGAVPPGLNECMTTTYGIRIKLFMRGVEEYDIYPKILAAACKPIKLN